MSDYDSPRFVRFGDLPRKPRSTNLLAGERLMGVSVYEGALIEPGLFRIDTSRLNGEQGLPALLGLAAADRPAFFVEGEEVGRGPDGEPLVSVEHIRPVPKTTSITSVELYCQKALHLWSKGPRDGSGTKFLRWRLGDEDSPYRPDDVVFGGGMMVNPHAEHARRKGKPGDKARKRRQRQARKSKGPISDSPGRIG